MESQKDDFVERILSSVFYKRSKGRAGRLLNNPKGLLELIRSVLTKANTGTSNGILGKIRHKAFTLINLVKAYATGEYRDISRGSIIAVVAALVYFILPLDFLPDFIPILGFADDLALLSFVIARVQDELEKFEFWELNKNLND